MNSLQTDGVNLNKDLRNVLYQYIKKETELPASLKHFDSLNNFNNSLLEYISNLHPDPLMVVPLREFTTAKDVRTVYDIFTLYYPSRIDFISHIDERKIEEEVIIDILYYLSLFDINNQSEQGLKNWMNIQVVGHIPPIQWARLIGTANNFFNSQSNRGPDSYALINKYKYFQQVVEAIGSY